MAAARVAGASVVIDSSKHSALAHCLRWSNAIELRVLQVVRDPRGVAYSWTKRVDRPETDGEQQSGRRNLRQRTARRNLAITHFAR